MTMDFHRYYNIDNYICSLTPDDTLKRMFVFPVALSLGSVAKPKVTSQKQFNAYQGCPYCLHPNEALFSGEIQRHYDSSEIFPLRSEESVIRDMFKAHDLAKSGRLKKSVNGFVGMSILLTLSDLLVLC